MSRRSILGKCAALTCSVVLMSSYVYERAGGEFLFSVRKPGTRANSVKRAPRRDPVSIWTPSYFSSSTMRFRWRGASHTTLKTTVDPVMQGYKSAITIPTVNISFGSDSDDFSTIDAAEITPMLGLPDIPGAPLPQQLELQP